MSSRAERELAAKLDQSLDAYMSNEQEVRADSRADNEQDLRELREGARRAKRDDRRMDEELWDGPPPSYIVSKVCLSHSRFTSLT